MAPTRFDPDTLPADAIKRWEALQALRDGPNDRAALMATLDVSRTTIHRIVRHLEARELITQAGREFSLTVFGSVVADEVATYRERVLAAERLKPFLETVPEPAADFDISLFADARVTTMEPRNPYAPLARFMELLTESDLLLGFDTTTIAPIYVDDIRDEILDGMETDVIYLPSVLEDMVAVYEAEIQTAVDSGQLTLSEHTELPFGLAIFEDRIGLGGYDSETGLLRVFVDTDATAAREWALDQFQGYREEATLLELSATSD